MHDIEAATKVIGRQLFALVREATPTPLEADWWDLRLMEWTLGDERLKYQALRFMDVLPVLKRPDEIVRHLHEYFPRPDSSLPLALRWGVAATQAIPAPVVAAATRRNVLRLARRFIAGAHLQETLAVIRHLRAQAMAFTLDLLGEATTSEVEADAYMSRYLALIRGLSHALPTGTEGSCPRLSACGGSGATVPAPSGATVLHAPEPPEVNVSLKLSALYSQFDPIDPQGSSAAVRARLRQILRAAREAHAFVHVDMEQYPFKDLTLRIVQEALAEREFAAFEDVGVVIQAYLKDSERDLSALVAWAERRGRPVTVRLVKGAYWDYEAVVARQRGWPVPVFQHKWETDANYEKLAEFLVRHHRLLRPALASHNVRSLAHALAAAEAAGLGRDALEFQLLHGMAEPIKRALVKMGCRVRVYVPSGHLLPGMGYLVRRILENTSNESFLRQSFLKHLPEEELLASPAETRAAESAKVHIGRSGLLPGSPKSGDVGCATSREGNGFVNEPDTDFSKEAHRAAMLKALADARGQFGRRYELFIGGQGVKAEGTMERRNPSWPSEVVGEVAMASREDAERALDAAQESFRLWRTTPAEKRAGFLNATAQVLRRRRFELAAWEVYEVGKSWREADADVSEAIDYLEYYAGEMRRLSHPRRLGHAPGEVNWYHYEPRGVGVVIAPWNFPLAILCGMTAAALVAGNTVVMKPAEQSSIVAAKLMEAFREAGVPSGVVNYLPGIGPEVGKHLVSSPRVDFVAFTGSKAVGLAIHAAASRTAKGQASPKRVIAEMGGKNAILVDSDADLDEAVVGVAASAFGFQGQKCSAASRAIVLDEVYEVFLGRLVEHTRGLKIGPAEDPATCVGPLVDEPARKKVERYIRIGQRKARLAFQAKTPSGLDGHFVGPMIFADVPPSARIAQEEIFGPVLAVMRARTFPEALTIANGTEYALTGGVYSRSPAHIELVKRQFHVGNLYINRKITGALVGRQPFGGFKMSGIGSKAGGPDYLLQFLLPRTVTENTLRHGFTPASEA